MVVLHAVIISMYSSGTDVHLAALSMKYFTCSKNRGSPFSSSFFPYKEGSTTAFYWGAPEKEAPIVSEGPLQGVDRLSRAFFEILESIIYL